MRDYIGSLPEAAAGSGAAVNDSPVGCQSRGVTEPAGESCQRKLTEGVYARKRFPSSPLFGKALKNMFHQFKLYHKKI